ncbi:hypothetical protein ABZS71_22610 [Streptomyces sp. NPDC005393]|uniref:hypothetical protein n=1 Tax=Streptomyces sp. NPDC005393 TaxID=3157041 RepID=UPI0033BA9A8B
MAAGHNRGGPAEHGRSPSPERGIPDGLLIGIIAFLLGLTGLVWSATGMAGLFSHGAWPDGVAFMRTPLALRHLVEHPHDLATAWPETPKEQLSGYGLFWGLFISELMVLIVLAIFAVGTLTRYRVVRARRRAVRAEAAEGKRRGDVGAPGAASGPAAGTGTEPGTGIEAAPRGGRPGADAAYEGRGHTATASGAASGPRSGYPSPPAPEAAPGPVRPNGAATSAPWPEVAAPGRAIVPGPPGTADVVPANEAAAPAGGHRPEPGAVPSGPAGPPLAAHNAATAPEPHRPIAEQRAGARGITAASGPESTGHTPQPPHGAAAPQPLPTPRTGGPVAAAAFPDGEPARSRILFGAQRGESAAHAVLEAAGPVLVVTSDPALWATTKDARAKFGPSHVFDPSHLLDTPARLRWNPAADCGSRDTAAARATALLAPVRPAHAMDKPMAEAAETMLRCWLHAAAVDGRPFRHVHRWAQGSSAHEPVRILRTHSKAAGGAAGELEATLTAHPERRDMAQELTARALGALSSIHIRDACNPGRADALALESFIGEGGTLYVMGESIEDPRTQPGAMPLLTALASHVVEHGRRMAERSSSGRLDPPLTLVLDDIAAVAPLPALPDLLTQGAAQGLPTLALMRSQEQARARWPHRTLAGQELS